MHDEGQIDAYPPGPVPFPPYGIFAAGWYKRKFTGLEILMRTFPNSWEEKFFDIRLFIKYETAII